MSLSIFSRRSLEDLQLLALEHFSRVENKEIQIPYGQPTPDLSLLPPSGSRQQQGATKVAGADWARVGVELGREVLICPSDEESDNSEMHLWCKIPDFSRDTESPVGFLTTVFAHEGEGSVDHALKRAGLITELIASDSIGSKR